MSAGRRLFRWEKIALGLLAVGVVVFGGLVEIRSAFQKTRKTDLGVYARAAWAVRAGQDPYSVTDDHGWHYCYPAAFAVVMAPFADPPGGVSRAGYLPFWLTAALWYALGVGCVAFAVHRFANAVLPGEPRGTRRWWYARLGPVYVALGAIGYTLARGQVNLLVVALVAGLAAAAAHGRAFRAGLWLGAAICVKVIPGLLGVAFLLRRDARGVVGTVAACVVGLGVIPALVWGIDGAVQVNRQMVEAVIAPGATGDGDQTRARELTNATATDSQSFQAVIHTWRHPEPATRPPAADADTRLAHWLISAALLLTVVAVGVVRRPETPADRVVFLGTLMALMLLVTPVSHMHYYAFGLPLVAGLWLKGLASRPGRVTPGRLLVPLIVWGVATAVPLFPWEFCEFCRHHGVGPAATLMLGAVGLVSLPGRKPAAEVRPAEAPLRRAA